MRVLCLIFLVTILVPIGFVRKVLQLSAFSERAYRNTSSWNSVRRKGADVRRLPHADDVRGDREMI